GFDEKFKAKLLADIKDLMIESDWHSIDKLALEKVKFREEKTQLHLESMVQEYESTIKQKL
ncbi:MAG: hypothetical protein ACKO96_37355, partial [Flammeovirgaceae bacterium]